MKKNISWRRALQVTLDFSLAITAWGAAYITRFNLDPGTLAQYLQPRSLLVFAAVQTLALLLVGNYSRLWRYTSLEDLRVLVMGVGVGMLSVLALAIAMPNIFFVPRGVVFSQPVFLLVLLGGVRVAWRLVQEQRKKRAAPRYGNPIVVVGAGDAAAALLREFNRNRRWRAVALLDDDRLKHRGVMHGVRVMGSVADFGAVAARYGVRKAVIAIPSLPPQRRDELARLLSAQGAEVYTLPPLDSIHPGEVVDDSMRRIRPEELLRREPIVLDRSPMHAAVEGRSVMVTGAGGSIGAELCRQLAELQPEMLILFELNEFALYQISEELRESWHQLNVVTAVGDVKDEVRVAEIMGRYRPHMVFHAAAYKHVPMMEQVNAFEALRNNAWGSLVVARCAINARVQHLVVVSTDKAVNPTNVMGATKRLAEMLVQRVTAGYPLTVSIVRFGNVLGSAGSVIPKFVEQIQRGGPVTVTHPEITRFFMSIPEAAQLVILSSSIGNGGEIFVLDMGESVRIVDLARDLIRLSGKTENEVGIVFTGLRPGEKLYEELLFDRETTQPTEHKRIRIARAHAPPDSVEAQFVEWLRESPTRSDFEVRQMLRKLLVSEYTPDARVHEDAQPQVKAA